MPTILFRSPEPGEQAAVTVEPGTAVLLGRNPDPGRLLRDSGATGSTEALLAALVGLPSGSLSGGAVDRAHDGAAGVGQPPPGLLPQER